MANKIIPVIFGPNLTRNTDIEAFDTLEDALNNVFESLGSDLSSESGINSVNDMLNICLLDDTKIIDNSITIQTETNIDTQDDYGTYMRISQKPLKGNLDRGYYYKDLKAKGGNFDLGDLLDMGIVGDGYTDLPNYDKSNFAYQGK